jgi:LmbE family N-acetylglucosaminyl deacetylase
MSSEKAPRPPILKAVVGAIAERAWLAAFTALRRVAPGRSASANLTDARRVLVIAPHPDDEAIGCGGTILLHHASGAHVAVCCVTDGRRSRAFGLDADEMARRRRDEAAACARVLRIDRFEWLGLPEGDWSHADLASWLQSTAALAVNVAYVPSGLDFHPEHRKTALALARFWSRGGERPDRVRIYPIQVPLTPLLTNIVVDVTSVMRDVRAALQTYATQVANVSRALRQRRYAARWHAAGQYAEEFWEMDVAAYIRLHETLEPALQERFRGLRQHPIFDPLAYASGMAARRRLARRSRTSS